MKRISISDATYERLLQVGKLTSQDPEVWAEAILSRFAAEVILLLENKDQSPPVPEADPPDAETLERERQEAYKRWQHENWLSLNAAVDEALDKTRAKLGLPPKRRKRPGRKGGI
ncbi:hypothetical protein [Caballeronia glathei]|uniref:Uncharacterized protein n=1 Tax=Caballeronia glathei TaxID=60547 RepID=A0A069PBB7_9BURK|nr:hypothetical protein [Caballeronia glathei]KDR37767.1 hypothetical protein BG61_07795 [Caballeronia glathei]